MKCDSCSGIIEPSFNFCSQCGIKLEPKVLDSGLDHATSDASASETLGLIWFRFWMYALTPSAILLSWFRGASSFYDVLFWVVIVIISGLISIGLYYRHLWGWRLNWVPVFLVTIFGVVPTDEELINNGLAYGISFFLLTLAYGLFWVWPNIVYWRKRRQLFAAVPFKETITTLLDDCRQMLESRQHQVIKRLKI